MLPHTAECAAAGRSFAAHYAQSASSENPRSATELKRLWGLLEQKKSQTVQINSLLSESVLMQIQSINAVTLLVWHRQRQLAEGCCHHHSLCSLIDPLCIEILSDLFDFRKYPYAVQKL